MTASKRFEELFAPSFIGFDQLLNRLSNLETVGNYPPYDIEQLDETGYRITIAVAGFTQDQLEVTEHEGKLTITGSRVAEDVENASAGVKVIHKGIAERSFERQFTLGDAVEVGEVELAHGLLKVSLTRNTPDEVQPKKYDIK